MAEHNQKLITFLKKNAEDVKSGSIKESEAVQASGIAPTKIGPALWAAEPVAVPACKFTANKGNIVKARKNGIRWERIAARTGKSVAEVKEIGGKEAAEIYTGRGRRTNGSGPAKASSGRRQQQSSGKGTSGRRTQSGNKGKGATPRARTRAERAAKSGSPK